jgi:tripartite-type tricarboxylate transporter receptor subunit TctC
MKRATALRIPGDIPMKALIALFLALAASLASAASTYPDRPIRLIVPFAPGQVTDWLARFVGEQMAAELGQPVVVENRPGANGTIGNTYAVSQPADGYTLVITSNGTHSAARSLFKKLAYDPVKDFAHIRGLISLPWMLLVRPDFPATNLTEFLDYAEANPGKLTVGYGSSSSRLCIHLLRTGAKLDILDVPYKGLGQTVIDVIGGQLQFTFLDMGSAMSQAKSGALRPIAVTSPKRSSVAPEVPAISEAIPGYEMVSWLAIAAPAGTPPEVLERVNAVVTKILDKPENRQKIAAYGGEVMKANGAQVIEAIDAESEVWAEFVREAGVEPQ